MQEAMPVSAKATRIHLFSIGTPQMRAFHMSWFAFFLCFFAWFGIAPLMTVVRAELALTQAQVGNCIIASVAMTILARLFIGWLCDRIGPRFAYTWLLLLGSLPVIGIGFARNYEAFLLFRLAIGVIGASFVITQYHTSVMFAPNIVGTANATTAGWGNLGGGMTQLVMPLLFVGFLTLGVNEFWGWRASMVVAGLTCMATSFAYYRFTQDCPEGNFKELRAAGRMPSKQQTTGSFLKACRDYRVWVLFVIYGACFGIELTIHNIAALYFSDYYNLGLKTAGIVAALFGMMNIFARTLGGYLGDVFGRRAGLRGRVRWLFLTLFMEGIFLMVFSRMTLLPLAIGSLLLFSLFVQMSSGATFSVVPFINRKALGSVAGIVGAGGNVGAVMAGFLFKGGMSWPTALLLLGGCVMTCSLLVWTLRFSDAVERESVEERKRIFVATGAMEAA